MFTEHFPRTASSERAGVWAGLFVGGSPSPRGAGVQLLPGGCPPWTGGDADLKGGFVGWERGAAEAHPTFRVSQLHGPPPAILIKFPGTRTDRD